MNIGLLLCIIGVIVNAAGISFNIYFLNIIAAISLLVGCIRMNFGKTPLEKKLTQYAIGDIIGATFSVFLYLFLDGAHSAFINVIALGINVFFYIYFTYYFTELIIDRAKQMNESAITRNFRSIWTMTGILSFVYFMVYYNLTVSIASIFAILFLLGSFYYCYMTNNIGSVVFTAS